MNFVAAGALEAGNMPLFLKAAPILDVTQSSYGHLPRFEYQNSWITVAIEDLPFPGESFSVFQRYFTKAYDQFQDLGILMTLKKTLCSMVLSAAVAAGKLGVIDWIVSILRLTNAEFSDIFLHLACKRKHLIGPVFRILDGRYGIIECCRNDLELLNPVVMAARSHADMDFIEYCLSKNAITSELASPLLTEIASETWNANAKSLAVMKSLQALPGFTLERNVLGRIFWSFVQFSERFPREIGLHTELVAWLKSLGATVNAVSLADFFYHKECLQILKLIFAVVGDESFPRDDFTIPKAFEASLDWSSSNNLSRLIDYLHSKGFGVRESAYTESLRYFYRCTPKEDTHDQHLLEKR